MASRATGKQQMIGELTLRRPDDWHLHLRDGDMLRAVLPFSARHFARAIIMPNLVPPVVTAAQAAAYRDRILAALPAGAAFEPLMTLYLTETTDPEDVAAAARSGLVKAVKLYPAGATTNSNSGVRDFSRVDGVLARMAEIGLPLCVHGEVTDPAVDIFDREAVFIERVLIPLRRRHPDLKVVMEHVTTRDGVEYVRGGGPSLAATLTVHHLIINRNTILVGGIRPHYYCLPIAKREEHRLALVEAATSGSAKFFLGTDSAPHPDHDKETACGCAGCFTAPNALACLAEVFERAGALNRLEAFASLNGPAFYGLPPNEETLTLRRAETPLPPFGKVSLPGASVTVFDPGFPLHWQVA
jgi:dihydroorotase